MTDKELLAAFGTSVKWTSRSKNRIYYRRGTAVRVIAQFDTIREARQLYRRWRSLVRDYYLTEGR